MIHNKTRRLSLRDEDIDLVVSALRSASKGHQSPSRRAHIERLAARLDERRPGNPNLTLDGQLTSPLAV